MRLLLYTPSYTVDRDPTSLRATQLMHQLGLRGWLCDIVASPVFHQGDAALRSELRELHRGLPYLRVFETHPGILGRVRYRLYLGAPSGARAPGQAGPRRRRAGVRSGIYGAMRRVHRGYAQVFARIGDPDWIAPAVLQGLWLTRRHNYDVVFASASSYFGAHIAAAIVSFLARIPLVADYVDPWGPPHPYPQKWLDRTLEAFVLRRAAGIIVANWRDRDRLVSYHSFLGPADIEVITQGYDAGVSAGEPIELPQEFVVLYTGSFYAGQSPLEFLRALRVARQQGLPLRFRRAGRPLSDAEARLLRESSLDGFMEDCGEISHRDAVALQRTATVLLAVGTTSRYQMPGKVIEYVAAGRPVLCLSSGPGDLAAAFVQDHGLGLVVPNQAEAILAALASLYALWRDGRLDAVYHPRDVEAYSWQSAAQRLERLFLAVSRTPPAAADAENPQSDPCRLPPSGPGSDVHCVSRCR